MSNARNLARLLPNASGQLPDVNLAAIAAGKVSGQLADANMSSGSVIQVVSGQLYSDRVTISSSSFVPVGAGVSITPLSASSKILVLANYSVDTSHEASIGRGANYNLCGIAHGLGTMSSSFWDYKHLIYMDSPTSTSQQTYYLTARGYSGSTSSVYFADFNAAGPFGYMTLMEIAA